MDEVEDSTMGESRREKPFSPNQSPAKKLIRNPNTIDTSGAKSAAKIDNSGPNATRDEQAAAAAAILTLKNDDGLGDIRHVPKDNDEEVTFNVNDDATQPWIEDESHSSHSSTTNINNTSEREENGTGESRSNNNGDTYVTPENKPNPPSDQPTTLDIDSDEDSSQDDDNENEEMADHDQDKIQHETGRRVVVEGMKKLKIDEMKASIARSSRSHSSKSVKSRQSRLSRRSNVSISSGYTYTKKKSCNNSAYSYSSKRSVQDTHYTFKKDDISAMDTKGFENRDEEGRLQVKMNQVTRQSYFEIDIPIATIQGGCHGDQGQCEDIFRKILNSLPGLARDIDEAAVLHQYPCAIDGESYGRDYPIDLLRDESTGHHTLYEAIRGEKAASYFHPLARNNLNPLTRSQWHDSRPFVSIRCSILMSHSMNAESFAKAVKSQWAPLVQTLIPTGPDDRQPYADFRIQACQVQASAVQKLYILLYTSRKTHLGNLQIELSNHMQVGVGVTYEQIRHNKKLVTEYLGDEKIYEKEFQPYCRAVHISCSVQAAHEVQGHLERIFHNKNSFISDDEISEMPICRNYKLIDVSQDINCMTKKEFSNYMQDLQNQVNFVRRTDVGFFEDSIVFYIPEGRILHMDQRPPSPEDEPDRVLPTCREAIQNITASNISFRHHAIESDNPDVCASLRRVFIAVENARADSQAYNLICHPDLVDEAKKAVRNLLPFFIAFHHRNMISCFTQSHIAINSQVRWELSLRDVVGRSSKELSSVQKNRNIGSISGVRFKTTAEVEQARVEKEQETLRLEKEKEEAEAKKKKEEEAAVQDAARREAEKVQKAKADAQARANAAKPTTQQKQKSPAARNQKPVQQTKLQGCKPNKPKAPSKNKLSQAQASVNAVKGTAPNPSKRTAKNGTKKASFGSNQGGKTVFQRRGRSIQRQASQKRSTSQHSHLSGKTTSSAQHRSASPTTRNVSGHGKSDSKAKGHASTSASNVTASTNKNPNGDNATAINATAVSHQTSLKNNRFSALAEDDEEDANEVSASTCVTLTVNENKNNPNSPPTMKRSEHGIPAPQNINSPSYAQVAQGKSDSIAKKLSSSLSDSVPPDINMEDASVRSKGGSNAP